MNGVWRSCIVEFSQLTFMLNQPFVTKLRTTFNRSAAIIGWIFVSLPAIYGSLLFCNQVYVWLSEDVWVPLPARYLFVQLRKEDENRGTILHNDAEGQKLSGKTRLNQKLLNRVIPIFRSDDSWIANPTSWLGVHRILSFLLDIFSIPILCILTTYVIVKISNFGD